MLENYLIVHKNILPDYFMSVIKVKKLLESGKCSNISQATKEVGISRSTFYKYKDYILEPSGAKIGRTIVLSMILLHEQGVLKNVLECISGNHANVLTITQSLPIRNRASVTLSLDISSLSDSIELFLEKLGNIKGVENPKIEALE